MRKTILSMVSLPAVICGIVISAYGEERVSLTEPAVEAIPAENDMIPLTVEGLNIRIKRCEANLDYEFLTASKFERLDSPEKIFNEYFVAVNTADWDKFEKLTVNFDDYCNRVKSTRKERKELLLNAWRAGNEKTRTFSLNYFVEYRGRYFLIMHSRYFHDGKYKGGPRPLPLRKEGSLYYFDANGFNAKDPIIHALLFTPFSEYDKALGKK